MKITKRYEIRTVRSGNAFTTPTNFRLYERARAGRLVKRLRKMGLDVVAAPTRVAA